MIKHKDSHTDHVPESVVTHVLERFADKAEFFIETFELPDCHGSTPLPALDNALYGPACGDEPVAESEVSYAPRPGRAYPSRLVKRPVRPTRTCTVIAGPHDGQPCVLFTVFGGPVSPQEIVDPSHPEDASEGSRKFWAKHALAVP